MVGVRFRTRVRVRVRTSSPEGRVREIGVVNEA